MAKQIKDANGFVLSWNRKKDHPRDRTVFVRYKNIIKSQPVWLIDLSSMLYKAMIEIEKIEKSKSNDQLVLRNDKWERVSHE